MHAHRSYLDSDHTYIHMPHTCIHTYRQYIHTDHTYIQTTNFCPPACSVDSQQTREQAYMHVKKSSDACVREHSLVFSLCRDVLDFLDCNGVHLTEGAISSTNVEDLVQGILGIKILDRFQTVWRWCGQNKSLHVHHKFVCMS